MRISMILGKILKNQATIEKRLSQIIQKYKVENTLSVEQIRTWVAEEDGPPNTTYKQFIQRAFAPFGHVQDGKDAQRIISVLNDAWNFFPHNSLAGKTPMETLQEERDLDTQQKKRSQTLSTPLPSDPVERAWHTLRWQREGIPWKAIQVLRRQPTTPELVKRLADGLSHTYDDTFIDDYDHHYYSTPLWYAIVAEAHLDAALIEPIITLFTTTKDDWDAIDEQGMWLIGALAKKYPDQVIPRVMQEIDRLLAQDSDLPYLFLFDALQFADPVNDKDWLLKVISQPSQWQDALVIHLSTLRIQEMIPILERRIEETDPDDHFVVEAQAAIREIKNGPQYPTSGKAYFEYREPWEKHYRVFEDRFYDDADVQEAATETNEPFTNPHRKVGRNDPCPCGSGKKFKRCCLP